MTGKSRGVRTETIQCESEGNDMTDTTATELVDIKGRDYLAAHPEIVKATS